MSSRLAYPYRKWVQKARYSKGYNVLTFDKYNRGGSPRRHLMRFFAQCDNTVFLEALLLKLFPLSLGEVAERSFFTLPRLSIANRDITTNRQYRTFYTPQAITQTPKSRMKQHAKSQCYYHSNTSEGNKDDLIDVLLKFNLFPYMWLINLHLEEVYITPFPPEYCLTTFVIYDGHTDPLHHILRFKR